MKYFKTFTILVYIFYLLSCSKETIQSASEEIENKDIKLKAAFPPTPDFDWENSNFINFQGTNIELPWPGTNSGNIPLEIKSDFKKIDGWRLLYNTFPYDSSDPVLVLYNAFRGTVRCFFYITSSSYTNNSFTWGMGAQTISGKYTSALNFSWAKPLVMNNRLANPSIFKANWCSDNTSIPNGVVPYYWYYIEFEVAYDDNIPQLNRDQIELQIRGFASEKKFIHTDGSITGSMKGTFNMPSSGGSSGILGAFGTALIGGSVSNTSISLPSKADVLSKLSKTVDEQSNSILKGLLNLGLNEYINGVISSSNPILGLISNSIFGTKASSTPGTINLNLTATTTETGTITSSMPGPAKSFFFPGSTTGSSTTGGYLPNYTKQIGVFNLDARPIIKYGYAVAPAMEPSRYQAYEFDTNSCNIVINTDITTYENATITMAKKELIFYNNGFLYSGGTVIDSQGYGTYTGDHIVLKWSGSPQTSTRFYNLIGANGRWGVRVTIGIRPPGYTQDIILIKEFEPQLVFDPTLMAL